MLLRDQNERTNERRRCSPVLHATYIVLRLKTRRARSVRRRNIYTTCTHMETKREKQHQAVAAAVQYQDEHLQSQHPGHERPAEKYSIVHDTKILEVSCMYTMHVRVGEGTIISTHINSNHHTTTITTINTITTTTTTMTATPTYPHLIPRLLSSYTGQTTHTHRSTSSTSSTSPTTTETRATPSPHLIPERVVKGRDPSPPVRCMYTTTVRWPHSTSLCSMRRSTWCSRGRTS